MGSPIFEMIYQSTGIDPAYFILILAVLTLTFFITTIIVLCKLKKLYKSYDTFMRGKDAESMEDKIEACIAKAEDIEKTNDDLRKMMRVLKENQRMTYQKMGMVKYDAFQGMKGSLSYVLALLNQEDNGFVLNSVYAREGGYSYIKEIVGGVCDGVLSEEEEEAIRRAKSQS